MSEYRVGNHQPQNVYRDEQYIGVMFSPEDAALVISALNQAFQNMRDDGIAVLGRATTAKSEHKSHYGTSECEGCGGQLTAHGFHQNGQTRCPDDPNYGDARPGGAAHNADYVAPGPWPGEHHDSDPDA